MGMAFFAFVLYAQAAETNFTMAKILPARQMLGIGGVVTTAPERKVSPPFIGKELPSPPKQHASWTAPKNDLPTNYVSATESLFAQGMADPRGCDYREIEVGTGEVWRGDGGVVSTHGWVLPGDHGQRFAVCWNGMVYPAVSVGTNANLEVDVALMETNGFNSWRSALPEAVMVSPYPLQGIKGCFLLRLGRADLASRLWLAMERRGRSNRNDMMRRFSQTNEIVATDEIKLSETDPYFTWANDWAWAMFDRMICAHERGDEKLALLTARQLAAAQPLIEAECARRGFKRDPYWDSRRQKELQPYLNFLDQFPALLADLERRGQAGPRVSVITSGLTNIPDQSKRIAALILDLDLAQAHQWGQPGGVNLAEAPEVSALIAEGNAAVEPLLECLENDQRLTRSVGFGRDFHRGRTVLTVNRAAFTALESILQAGFGGGAPEIRAYWNKYKNLKIEDRWYAILNDDSARARWQEAASRIVQPENVTAYPGGYSTVAPAPSHAPVRLRGEMLRAKTNPSVTELLTRHALEIPTNRIGTYDLGASCALAESLARWDAAAALPVAQTLVKRACTVMQFSGQQLGAAVAKLTLARASAGDPQAFDDYAGWLVATTPAQLGYSLKECLEPLLKFPTNKVLRAAALKLYADSNSPWAQLPWKENHSFNPLDSGLVRNPAFRLLLVRELEKTNVCGTFTWREPGQVSYEITNYQNGSYGAIAFPAGSQPTNSTVSELRWCDWIAFQLSNGKFVSFFDPFAPVPQRDAAIQAAKARLARPWD